MRTLFFKILIAILGIEIIIYLSMHLNRYGWNIPEYSSLDFKEYHEVLIVAPHNDDEVLGTGGVIQKHLSNGANVRVVMMTNGDGQYRGPLATKKKEIELGYRRQKETINALTYLGVKEENIIFLGYPDKGLHELWNNYWDCRSLYRSNRTGQDHTEYQNSYKVGAPYCGLSVVEDLKKIILNRIPDIIYMPHPYDLHQDHWATNAFVTYAVEKLKAENPNDEKLFKIREMTYLVHFWRFPLPRGKKLNNLLIPPKQLYELDSKLVMVELSPEETEKKFTAIRMYKSQLIYMPRYLESFARKNEFFSIFSPLSLNKSPMFENYMNDPELLSGNESEIFEESNPFLTYFDPRHKSIYTDTRRFNDIKAVEVSKSDSKLNIRVVCYQKLNFANDFTIHVKTIDDSSDDRSFIFTLKKKSIYLNGEELTDNLEFGHALEKDSFMINIPLEVIGNPQKIILGAEILRNGYSFSKSSYRIIQL